MKRIIPKCMLAALVAALAVGLAAQASAQTTGGTGNKDATKEAAPKAKNDRAPFKGKIDAVDQTAKTIKVGERTFCVTSTTKISKGGQPATFADATVGEEVGGQYKTGTGDKLDLISLRIGPRPDKAAPADAKKKP
jgi:hypothetical protein